MKAIAEASLKVIVDGTLLNWKHWVPFNNLPFFTQTAMHCILLPKLDLFHALTPSLLFNFLSSPKTYALKTHQKWTNPPTQGWRVCKADSKLFLCLCWGNGSSSPQTALGNKELIFILQTMLGFAVVAKGPQRGCFPPAAGVWCWPHHAVCSHCSCVPAEHGAGSTAAPASTAQSPAEAQDRKAEIRGLLWLSPAR